MSRDVSGTGVFFYAEDWRLGLSSIEFKMILPAQITGSESMRVVCKGRVVRLEEGPQAKMGVAATIDSYEFG